MKVLAFVLFSAMSFGATAQPCFSPGPCGPVEPAVQGSIKHLKVPDCTSSDGVEIKSEIYNPSFVPMAGARGFSHDEQCEAIYCAVVYGGECP